MVNAPASIPVPAGEAVVPAPREPAPAAPAAPTPRASSTGRAHRLLRWLGGLVVPTLSVTGVLVIWELWVRIGDVAEYTLPAPTVIVDRMVEDHELFLRHTAPTLRAIVLGFGMAIVVSVPLAIGMVYWSVLRKVLYPLVVVSQVVPKVALAPLFLIWLGYGPSSKIFMAFLISFFPILVESEAGFASTRTSSVMLFRSMGANRWREFWQLRLPNSLPHLFAGLKVGVTLAVTGEIVGEFVGADQGLGYLLELARGNLDTTMIFAAIGYLVIVGSTLYLLVEGAERFALRHRRPHA